MELKFGLSQATEIKKMYVSWIRFFIIYSVLCMWTNVECWSYFYSNTTMNWTEARTWCRNHYTDMVAIQNQEEIQYLKEMLPFKEGYYWIGIRKIDDHWTWVGTNKTLTAEATNWAKNEPNNGKNNEDTSKSEDCVEMYIGRKTEGGKWNDEWCAKNKTALCFTAACEKDSCFHGDCVETINSHKCDCFPGFYGQRCEHVVECQADELLVPDKGNLSCTHKYEDFSYNSTCQYSCEEGYQASVQKPLRCTETGDWSDSPATCQLVQCEMLSQPRHGFMECSDPLGPSSYWSTCVFTCSEGYELKENLSNTLQCGSSGRWNDSQPSCIVVKCPALQHIDKGNITCESDADDIFSYGKTCSFSCASGHRLVGPSMVTCTSTALWSDQIPYCEAITCQNPEGGRHLITDCSKHQTDLQPGSTCNFSCESGYELQGAHITICSEDGQWREATPTCTAVQCPALLDLKNGFVKCEGGPESKFSFGNTCSFSCAPGFRLHGANTAICSEDGQWSVAMPTCTAIHCSKVEHLENGVVKCDGGPRRKFEYGNTCSFSCAPGFLLQGANTTICSGDGQWSKAMPICGAVRCPQLQVPENGKMICSEHEPIFNSYCSFTCDQSFTLEGKEILTCEHNSSWSAKQPSCQAVSSNYIVVASVAAGGSILSSGLMMSFWILKQLKKGTYKFDSKKNKFDLDLL